MKEAIINIILIIAGVYGIPIPAHLIPKSIKINWNKIWRFTKRIPSVLCVLIVASVIAFVVLIYRLLFKPKVQHYESFNE